MHRFRRSYWNCSKFADWVRGTKKPFALQWHEWHEWHEQSRAAHPFRYWVAETLLNKAQNFFYAPTDAYETVAAYAYNRWVAKTNACVAEPEHIKPGQYVDSGDKFLPCMFGEFSKFVKRNRHILDPANDVEGNETFNKEVRELWEWWSSTRPNRKDPHEVLNGNSISDGKFEIDVKDFEEHDRILQENRAQDEEMLIRLIKLRNSLWD